MQDFFNKEMDVASQHQNRDQQKSTKRLERAREINTIEGESEGPKWKNKIDTFIKMIIPPLSF